MFFPLQALKPKQGMSLFWFALLLAYACAESATAGIRSGVQDKNIFILAGQSNMAGRGGVTGDKWDGIVPPECQPNPSILRLNSRLGWEEAREPLHADIDVTKTNGVGPGMGFANSVRAMDSSIGTVGLVPCAIGGTNISEWRHGSRLYRKLVKRTESSLKEGGRLRAILWYQGESDTVSEGDAERYGEKLKRFVSDLRADLHSPTLPFIQVALASGEGTFIEMVRSDQLSLDLPNVWTVDAKGLQLGPDNLHLTTASQVKLGQMLAQAFVKTDHHKLMHLTNHAHKRFF